MKSKKWIDLEVDDHKINEVYKHTSLHPIQQQILFQKQIILEKEIADYLNITWIQLHNPFLMKGVQKAINRLLEAKMKGDKVLLFGDYDVDGITSVAILFQFLQNEGFALDFYFPDREKEGYGLSIQSIEYAKAHQIKLIVAMDCGISAKSEVGYANSLGIDVIICDHHLPGNDLPKAIAILNPKQQDCTYPFKELSGCGVVFKMIQGYAQKVERSQDQLVTLLDLVAISIASDIVPLTGENRILAGLGLKQLEKTERIGLKTLFKKSSIHFPLSINKIVFRIAPLINAAGRMADADQAVRLLLAENKSVAEHYAEVLVQRNKIRKGFDKEITEEAIVQAKELGENKDSYVLYKPHWHKGVIGIVASRIVQTFKRPAIVLTQSEGILVGSARSAHQINLIHILDGCSNLLLSYGGHANAAGLSLWPYQLTAFRDQFEAQAAVQLSGKDLRQTIKINASVDLTEIDWDLLEQINQLGPFGPENRRPVLKNRAPVKVVQAQKLSGNHLRLRLMGKEEIDAIAFDLGDWIEEISQQKPIDICFVIEENNWKDQRKLQLQIKDIRIHQKQ